MSAYYNENDPFAAAWLRELIKANQIAPGEVDERSIEDVLPSDLTGFDQCHFFAGIGGWSYALRCAGWPDDRPVWTGSCPCQPFSAAGKRGGTSDERHLWPAFFHLISQSAPCVLFGEQVASKDGLAWLDTVLADLESKDYASWAFDLCAAGFGAPHIRQRLYFVADSTGVRRQQRRGASASALQGQCSERGGEHTESGHERELSGRSEGLCGVGGMADSSYEQLDRSGNSGQAGRSQHSDGSELGNTNDSGPQGRLLGRVGTDQLPSGTTGLVNGVWHPADWIYCRDEKYRPVETGTFPLAHGISNRVGKLRGYGNAICAPVAQAFIEAYLECTISQ